MENDDAIIYLGETNFRGKAVKFGIKSKDRTKHMYVIGKSGVGKSTLLENMAVQDIQQGRGLGFLDPHGGSADKLLEYIPEHRRKDVIYFAPFDTDHPISFNVMEDVGPDKRHLVADGLLSAFKKIWVDSFSARMETILRNTLLALLETPESTLLGVNRMLSDKDFRKWVVSQIKDDSVRSFWINEYGKWDPKYATEAGAAIQNKIGQFTANPIIRNIIGQPRSSFDFREAMDSKKILILNLSKGRMGDESAALVGAMLITKIYLAAMSRADATAEQMSRLPSFSFYADEFQNFANDSFANILSEARKYKLALTLAHQYVEQLPETIQSAVKGNMGSMIIFRVGATDAELFEKEFAPVFLAEDFTNLGFAQMYLRISIDGIGSKPFSASSLPPIPVMPNSEDLRQSIIQDSRAQYSRPREQVEAFIGDWFHKSFAAERPARAPGEDPGLDAFMEDDKPKTPKNVFRASDPFVPRKPMTPATSTPVSAAPGTPHSTQSQPVAASPQPIQSTPVTPTPTTPVARQEEEVPEVRPQKLFVSGDLGSLLNQLDPTVPVVGTMEKVEANTPEAPKAPTPAARPIQNPQPSIQPQRQPILVKTVAKPAAPMPPVQPVPTPEQSARTPILVKATPVVPTTPVVRPAPTAVTKPVVAAQPQLRPSVPIQQARPTPVPQKPAAPFVSTLTPKPVLGAQADKSAPSESRDALRDILQQAMKTAAVEPKLEVPKPEPLVEIKPEIPASPIIQPTPIAQPIPEPIISAPKSVQQSITDFRPKAVKEVPEDILRRILE